MQMYGMDGDYVPTAENNAEVGWPSIQIKQDLTTLRHSYNDKTAIVICDEVHFNGEFNRMSPRWMLKNLVK